MMCTYLRPSLPSRNATVPSQSANKVWSLPMPTLEPGCHLVPRWRTMMLPARAAWLPKSFTPRRLLSLSRPLRLEPPAFLCAMANYFFSDFFLAAPLAGAASFVDGALALAAFGSAVLAASAFGPSALLGAGL